MMTTRMTPVLLGALLAFAVRAAAPDAPRPGVQTRGSQAAMPRADALARLQAGNARFVSNAPTRRDWPADVKATASGQYPFAAVVSCMDSRGPVEILFDQGVGARFSVRI